MVRRERLPGGLRLLVREARTSPVVALNLWVGGGSAADPEGLEGLSHFVEHLLFGGGTSGGSVGIARRVQEAGGHLNAETGCDYTVYHQVVPSESWQDVLAAQAEAATAPAFTDEHVERERAVIIEEARSSDGNPPVFTWRRLMELAFSDHPYGRPVVGTVDSISRITSGDLREHHSRYYVSSNMLQVAVGDLDEERAVEAATALLSDIKHGTGPSRSRGARPGGSMLRARQYSGDVAQPYVAVAFNVPHALHPDTAALDALSGLLGVGRSSRLRKRLRTEQGLVSDVGAGVAAYRDAGLLGVRAVGATDDSDAVLLGIFREVERLRCEPPSPKEMEKNLRRLESGYVLAHETADSVAHSIGFFETLGDYSYAEEYVDRLAAVRTQDIVRVAREYLAPAGATVVTYVPGTVGAAVVDRSAEVAEIARRATITLRGAGASAAAWMPSSFTRPDVLREAGAPRSSTTSLTAGGTLVAREQKEFPIVSVILAFRGGVVEEPGELHGITCLMHRMALLGTGRRSADAIADDIEELGTAVSSAVDRDGVGWGVTVVSKHLERALSVLGDVVGDPLFPPERLAAVKAEVLAEMGEIEDHPIQRALLRLVPLVFPGSPYGRPIRGTRDSIEAVSVEDIALWHERVCASRSIVACAVGDARPEDVRGAIDSALGSHRPSEAAPRAYDGPAAAPPAPPEGVVVEEAPGWRQSVIALGFGGPVTGTREATVARVVAGAMSMMGGRLWEALRERPPHAYHAGATQIAYRGCGATVAYATSPPGAEEHAVEGILTELTRLVRDGLREDELQRARRHIAGTLEIALMRGATRAAAYAMAEVEGAGHEYVETMPDAVRTVTNDEIIDVARRYLDCDKGFAKVIVRGRA